jgi:hypothetical protein
MTRNLTSSGLALCIALFVILGTGCTRGTGFGIFGGPLILPEAARLGDTVAMVIANSEVRASEELFDFSTDNIRVHLSAGGSEELIVPRAILEVPLWAGAMFSRTHGDDVGQTLKVVLFDVSGTWSPVPTELTVSIRRRTYLGGYYAYLPYGYDRKLEILGGGGSPIVFGPFSPVADFETQPMYRLAPTWDVLQGQGINPDWDIAGMEFTLRYDGNRVSLPKVRAGGAASGALVVVGAETPTSSDTTVKVALVKPEGFDPYESTNIPCPFTLTGKCYSPAPVLDISFVKNNGAVGWGQEVFGVDTFTLENLKLYGPDGQEWSNPSGTADPNNYFVRAVVRNLRE